MEHLLSLATFSKPFCSEIIFGKGILLTSDWMAFLKMRRLALITDHSVEKLYGCSLKKVLEEKGFEAHLFSIPPGEKYKTRQWKETIENQMLDAKLGKDTVVIALGGGVILDLAGFVAATYCRGVSFISIPTTLLAQIDASIGGKVGINTTHGKNLIGAFHAPDLILIDSDILATLPSEELRYGQSEMIKYALTTSKSLFKKLENPLAWKECIFESCCIKKEIVEKDPYEEGLRRILNFGHTVGHAIETLTDYQVPHGEAVALGILAEAHLSWRLGYLPEEEKAAVRNILKSYGFSIRLPSHINEKDLIQAMHADKKAMANEPRFVLLKSIGEVMPFEGIYCRSVDQEILIESLRWLH